MYILLACSVGFALAYAALLHANRQGSTPYEAFRFSSMMAVVTVAVAGILGMRELPQKDTLVWGAVYGVALTLYLYCKGQALATGSMSITTLLGCMSLVLQTIVGTIFWHETVTLSQILGVVLMLVAMVLSIGFSKDGKVSARWLWYCAGLIVSNTVIGLIFKIHQSTPAANQNHELLVVAFSIGAVLTFLCSRPLRTKYPNVPKAGKGLWIWAILCGATSCGYSLLNTKLAGAIPSVIFYPVFNGSLIVFSLPLSMLFFHEKATARNISAILIAVLAILFLGKVLALPL